MPGWSVKSPSNGENYSGSSNPNYVLCHKKDLEDLIKTSEQYSKDKKLWQEERETYTAQVLILEANIIALQKK